MIRIQDHLNRIDADLYLKKMARNYWLHLNPKNKTKKYSSTSLIEICRKLYKDCSTPEYVAKYADGSTAKAHRHKKFFMLLKKNNFSFLRQIILSPPSEFNNLRTEIFTKLEESDFLNIRGGKISQTQFGALLSERLFNYKKFRSSVYCVQMYIDLNFLLSSCPYCNDRTVEVVKKNVAAGAIPANIAYFDLDHFYPKSQNPYFALSFYNLVPSCNACNSKEKADMPFDITTHLHPYLSSFDDFYEFEFSSKLLLGVPASKIIFKPKTAQTFQNINDFNLENRYDNRVEEINTMVKYYQNYYKTLNTQIEKELFIKYFTDINPAVYDKKSILKKNRSKLYRDVIKKVDVGNIIGIID